MTRNGIEQLIDAAVSSGDTVLDLTDAEFASSATASELLVQADDHDVTLRVSADGQLEQMLHIISNRREDGGYDSLRHTYTDVQG